MLNFLNKSAILKNFSALFAEKIIRLFLGFGISVVMARFLSLENYGRFNYVVTFVLIFLPFFSFGIDDIIVKHFIENPDKKLLTIKSSNFIRLCSSILGFVLVNICFLIIGKDLSENYLPLLFFSLGYLTKAYETYKLVFTADTNEVALVSGRSIIFILLSLGKGLVAYAFNEWKVIVYISALELPLFTLYGYLKCRKDYNLGPLPKLKDKTLVNDLYKLGVGIFIIQFLSLAYNRVDQIMILNFLGYGELGYYSIVAKLVELWTFIPAAMIVSLYPKIISLEGSLRRQEIRKMYSFVVWFGLLLTLGIFFVKKPLIETLYGERYLEAINIMTIYSISITFHFFNIARIKYIIFEKIEITAIFYGLFSLTLNIILNYFLIKKYGIIGAIYGTILSDLCANTIFSIFSKPMRSSCIDLIYAILLPMQIIFKKRTPI